MKTEFKVGQRKYSAIHGCWGVIREIRDNDLLVKIDGTPIGASFLLDGSYKEGGLQMLFDHEVEFVEKKWTPKKGEWCWFWHKGQEHGKLCRFLEIVEGSFMSHTGYYFDFCAPFVGELPEHLKGVEVTKA